MCAEFLYKPVEIRRIGETSITSGTLDTYAKARYYSATTLFSGSVFTNSGTVVASTVVSVSSCYNKTVSAYLTGSNGTVFIRGAYTASGNPQVFYTANLTAGTMTTYTFTDAFNRVRADLRATTTNGTVSSWLGVQT